MLLEAVFWGGLGLIFGSFTNVLILRHDTGRTFGGRSACPHCGKTLQWSELVPVISWLALRGRCGTCHATISVQYPIVEILAGVGLILVGLSLVPLPVRILGCAIVILLIAIAVFDIQHTIMPDAWVYSFAALAFLSSASSLLNSSEGAWSYALLTIAGPLIAFPLWFLWFISRGAWMGFGDVKYALGMGWLLGVWHGFLALTLSFMTGAIVGVCILLPLPHILRALRHIGITGLGNDRIGFTMKSEVPFGPFLIFGTCIIWFLQLYNYDPALLIPGASVFWNFWW